MLNFNKIAKTLVIIGSYLILGVGIVLFVLVFFLHSTMPGIMVTMVFSGFSTSLVMLYIVPTIVILRYHLKDKPKYAFIVVVITGILIVSSLMPIIAVPSSVQDADNQFRALYGEDYDKLDTTGMSQEPLSLWNLYHVLPSKNPEVDIQVDIEYFDNGDDKFYFDYYTPKSGEGPYPVIINIHGGAWVLGNRGPINNVQFSKHIASQGYVVFDIQYGLSTSASFLMDRETMEDMLAGNEAMKDKVLPDYNQNYLIQDQLANIGQFTKFLASKAEEYDADLSNVFVVGRSAGGHLAGVVGTGYYNPKFSGTFSNDLTIKGAALYYPLTDATVDEYPMGLLDDGTFSEAALLEEAKKYSPKYLIQDDNYVPPLIIVHGSHDNLVPYQTQAVEFLETARTNERDCILVTIPYEGHGYDLFNSQNPGWQMSTYYIERFMVLEVD